MSELRFGQCAPMAARQIAQSKVSNSRTSEPFHFISHRVEHAANLTIDSLSQNHAQSRGRDGMKPGNLRALTVEKDSAQEFGGERRVPGPIQDHFVFLVDLVTRVGELLRQLAVISQEQQTFAWRVQPADVKQPRKFRWKKVENGIACVRIAPG